MRARGWLLAVLALEVLLFVPSLVADGIIRAPLPKASESTGLFYAWQLFWRDEVVAGRFPFWNPFVFGGLPIAGEPQAHTFYPVHLLSLIASPELAFKLSFLLHVLLGSWLMYRLARELDATRFGASVSALVYGLHAQLIGFVYAGWIHQVMPMAWAPGIVWLFCRALRDRRPLPSRAIAGAGVLLGIQICSGHPEWVRYTLFMLLMLAIGGLRVRSEEARKPLGRRLVILAAVVVLGGAIGGVQLLPLLQATQHSPRALDAVASGIVRHGAGFPLLTLPTIVIPRLFGPWDQQISVDGLAHKLSGSLVSYSESLIYVGVLPLLLAFIAWRRRRESGAGIWFLIAAAGLLFALNDLTHLQSALDRVITLDAVFRSPARWVFLTNFSLAVLAGLGASQLAAAPAAAARAGRIAIALAAFMALTATLVVVIRGPIVSAALARVSVPAYVASDPQVSVDGGRRLAEWAIGQSAIATLMSAVLMFVAGVVAIQVSRRFGTRQRSMVLAAIAIDLAVLAYPLLSTVVPPAAAYEQDAALLAPIAGDPAARLSTRHLSAFTSSDNVSIVLRARSLVGYDSFSVAEWNRLWKVVQSGDAETLAAAGVTHVIEDSSAGPRLVEVSRARGHLWWTDRAEDVSSADEAVAQLARQTGSGPVVLEQPRSGPATIADQTGLTATIAVQQDVPGRVRASINAPAVGWIVFTDIMYPGWTARVNGVQTPIARAFGSMQALPLPAGQSIVEFEFRPRIVWWGAGLTLVGLIAAVASGGLFRGFANIFGGQNSGHGRSAATVAAHERHPDKTP